MKIIHFRTFLMLVAFVGSTALFGAEPTHIVRKASSSLEHDLDRALNRYLIYPLAAQGDMNGEVTVSFVIDKEGKVVVLESHSANERLKTYVLRKLARICIGENPEGSWKTTYIRFNFHPEKA